MATASPHSTICRCALPALLIFLVPDLAPAESFQGTFAGEGLVLTLQPAGEHLAGTLIFDERFYAVEAREEGGELHGTFAADGGEFDFRATLSGGVLRFETNAITYVLRRTGEGGRAAQEEPQEEAAEPEPVAEPAPENGAPEDLPSQESGDGRASEPAAPAEMRSAAPVVGEVERDGRLVGTWERAEIAVDAGSAVGGASTLELAADGSYAARGEAAARSGDWRTGDGTLLLRPADADAWQRHCAYRVVADTLLCTLDEGTRQLWHRR